MTQSIEAIWWDSKFEENSAQWFDSIVASPDPVVLCLLWEAIDPDNGWGDRLSSLVSQIKLKQPDKAVILVMNSWYQQYPQFKQLKSIDDIVYLDFFLLLVYQRLVVGKESAIVSTWYPDTNKFLFLTGKPNKIQRIRLLYKFSTNQMLSAAVWSLFYLATKMKGCKKFIPELTEIEFSKFLDDHYCNPDNIEIIKWKPELMHYSGIPYESIIYRDCDFQVISETHFSDDSAWITEKTWLSIINHRPFIIAGDTGTLKKLKAMGFRTFEKYLKISDYDDLLDSEQRLDSVVANTQYWLKHITEYRKEIAEDIEHNFTRMLELAQVNLQSIQSIIDKYSLETVPEKLIPLYDNLALAEWKEWYERVRDPAWPDCDNEEDFFRLPQWIQSELIEVFNYKPKKTT
jgi:hypothetical protein